MGTFREKPNSPIIIRGSYFEDEQEPIIKVCEEKSQQDIISNTQDDTEDYDIDLDDFFTLPKDNPTNTNIKDSKDEGNLGVFLYQSILATIIAIGYTILSITFAPVSENLLTTIKSLTSNDFSFSTALYQSVGTFFTNMNEQRPLQLNTQLLGNTIDDTSFTQDVFDDTIDDTEILDGENEFINIDINEDTTNEDLIDTNNDIIETNLEVEETITTNSVIQELPMNVTLTPIIFAGDIIFPISDYYRVTSGFGFRTNPVTNQDEFHSAYDLASDRGTNILAVLDGVITDSRLSTDLGNFIIIDHGQGLTSLYGHCDELLVEVGDNVKQGDVIATVGNTGTSTGNHLHFAMKIDGIYFDPSHIFKTELGGE